MTWSCAGMTVTENGEVLLAPATGAGLGGSCPDGRPRPPPCRLPEEDERFARGWIGAAAAVFLLLSPVSPEPFLSHFMVFALAVVIGFYVIGNVHHALYTR